MKSTSFFPSAICGLGLLLFPATGWSQDSHDLMDQDVRSEDIIKALDPGHGGQQMRGIGPVATTPHCAPPVVAKTRGIGITDTPEPPVHKAYLKVEFATDSADLTQEATRTLDELGKALTSNELSACHFKIGGHTDSRGTDAYNQDLSLQRAKQVRQYLTAQHGINAERLLVEGYGESKLIAEESSSEGMQRNRRVEVINLYDGSSK